MQQDPLLCDPADDATFNFVSHVLSETMCRVIVTVPMRWDAAYRTHCWLGAAPAALAA